MKSLVTIVLITLLNWNSSFGETIPVSTLRKIFHTAVMDASFISDFVCEMDKINDPTPIELAYKAAAEALKAQEEWNPVEKLLYLRKFRKLMTKAVERDVDDVEIRFLRFGIEFNIPDIFGFSNDMSVDKQSILDTLSKIEKFDVDQYFAVYIVNLLTDSGLCTEEEIIFVKNKIERPVRPISN